MNAPTATNGTSPEAAQNKKSKVALVFVCLNEPYWPFLRDVIEDARKFFLTNHQVDFFTWSDMPEDVNYGATVFPTEPVPWPQPTLMRYHLFLQQEEILSTYDYIFYLDADMRIVAPVTEEILCDGLTAAEHPMYSLSPRFIPPYEPNFDSTAYVPRLGAIITDEDGKKRLKPIYAAGGFQGGKASEFITAMKVMKENINKDLSKNYVAIWNDESHWNRYLLTYPGKILVLPPSYIYPDSLIKEYYEKIWGRSYNPIIVTLTKKFSISPEGGNAVKQNLEQLKGL